MGAVYTAEHTLIGRKVAIKVLLPRFCNNPTIVRRFFNEAKATAAIGHPGIVDMFDFGYHSDGQAYLVMEYLEGEPLSKRLKRIKRMPIEQGLSLFKQMASALGAAHSKRIVHRDLKPANIMLTPDSAVRFGERAKILDFGIAKLAHGGNENSIRTRTDVVMGTPSYMAPEQCRGAGGVDQRADLYALGCILFHMLCGQPPFKGEGAGELIGMQQFVAPPVPRDLVGSIPCEINDLILRLLEKNPDRRPGSTDEIITILQQAESKDVMKTANHLLPDNHTTLGNENFPVRALPKAPATYNHGLATPSMATTRPHPSDEQQTVPELYLDGPKPLPEPTTLGGAAAQRVRHSPSRQLRLVFAAVSVFFVSFGVILMSIDDDVPTSNTPMTIENIASSAYRSDARGADEQSANGHQGVIAESVKAVARDDRDASIPSSVPYPVMESSPSPPSGRERERPKRAMNASKRARPSAHTNKEKKYVSSDDDSRIAIDEIFGKEEIIPDDDVRDKVDKLVDKAKTEYSAGHLRKAYLSCRQALNLAPGDVLASRICALVACQIHSPARAKKYASSLPKKDKKSIEHICSDYGVDIR